MEATKSRKHMPIIQTSENNPLRIAEVRPRPDHGRIGITLCPGKKDDDGAFGRHDRNLAVDLDAVRDWGAAAVVSLMTDDEFNLLSVRDLGDEVRARHMTWLHLPIRDGHSPPEDTFESAWKYAGPYVRSLSRSRFDVLVHCRGGLGRAGTVAARLLVELCARPEEAIREVRCVRPGAIEAAVTGQLAGALYGLSGIPRDWVTRLAWRERLLAAAERLLWRKHRVSPRSRCSSGSPRRRSGPAVP